MNLSMYNGQIIHSLSGSNRVKAFHIMRNSRKTLKERKKTLKNEKYRKNQKTNNEGKCLYLYFFIWKNLHFVQKHTLEKLLRCKAFQMR